MGGWALVEGPGFGLSGPALIGAADDLIRMKVYYVSVNITGIIYDTLVSKETTILGLKKMMCAENGLTVHHVCFGKDLPPMNPNGSGTRLGADYMLELSDTKKLGECGWTDTGIIIMFYVDDLPDNIDIKVQPLPKIETR